LSVKPKVSVCSNPNLVDAVKVIQNGLAKGETITISGCCRVNYSGRASSTLGLGERIIIVKADGSVLVHRPVGYEPVNWQPSGCLVNAEIVDGELKVRAVRLQPREVVSIFFTKVYLVSSIKLIDDGDFTLFVSEQQMREAILSEPSMVEVGFRVLSVERPMEEAGFTDIIGEDSSGNLVVIEIKRSSAGKDAVLQLKRYMESIQKTLNRPVRGIIVAPSLRKGSQGLLATLNLEFKSISLARCYRILAERGLRKLHEFL